MGVLIACIKDDMCYYQDMYIDVIPNRNSPPAILLRESIRQGKKIVKRTIANLSSLSLEQAYLIRQVLKGKPLVAAESCFDIVKSKAHGNVNAVLLAMRKLGFDKLIATHHSKKRDLVVAMIASRILNPESKLAFSRSWGNSTLGELLGIEEAGEDKLYAAMDWLHERQDIIEKKLAQRHLNQGDRVLYDLSSSYFEGTQCPLAKRGYSRDQKKGKLQVNYGLLTDKRGCPISISAFAGNTSDSTTLLPQVERLQNNFGLESVILVGDRGMISEVQLKILRERSGVDWITALKSGAIRKLCDDKVIQLTLFDERNLFECIHADFPGERLIACRNPELAHHRRKTRISLLEATTQALTKIQEMVARGTLKDADKIGVRVGRVINKYKMAKHIKLDIAERTFCFEIDTQSVSKEAELDGIYVIRSSLDKETRTANDIVLDYKSLSQVERAFRSIKTTDLEVRPICHYSEQRVRAHLFICMLAYYVKWHMMEAWRSLLFADEKQAAKRERDPVASAIRSDSAEMKVRSKKLANGLPVHSFQSLLSNLKSIVRNTCRRRDANVTEPNFVIDTQLTDTQHNAYQLLKNITM